LNKAGNCPAIANFLGFKVHKTGIGKAYVVKVHVKGDHHLGN